MRLPRWVRVFNIGPLQSSCKTLPNIHIGIYIYQLTVVSLLFGLFQLWSFASLFLNHLFLFFFLLFFLVSWDTEPKLATFLLFVLCARCKWDCREQLQSVVCPWSSATRAAWVQCSEQGENNNAKQKCLRCRMTHGRHATAFSVLSLDLSGGWKSIHWGSCVALVDAAWAPVRYRPICVCASFQFHECFFWSVSSHFCPIVE